MHIPDGFVSGPINATTAVVSTAALAYSMSKVKREMSNQTFAVPLLATMAAFVFAAQMLNFPIGGGTSGHFLGAATAAALLGPWGAFIVLSVVLVIQGLLFGDGGITALGSNILNMGIVGGIMIFPLMRWLRLLLPQGRPGYFAAAAAASWLSVVAASMFCAFELALSGTSPLVVALPAMAGTHVLIGIGEAMICAAVLTAVATARPDILPSWADIGKSTPNEQRVNRGAWGLAGAGLALALALAVFGSPFASSFPDGLEKVAEDKGFLETASEDKILWKGSPFPDYQITSVEQEGVSASLAGLIGTIFVFGAGFGLIRLLVRQPEKLR